MRKFLSLLLLAISFQLFAYEVVVLSDTHYDSRELHPGVKKFEGTTKRNINAWEKRMPQMLQTYRELARKAAFVIHCGDLAQGHFSKENDDGEIQAVTAGIQAFAEKIPGRFYCVKGNHETYCINPATSSDKVILDYLKSINVTPSGLNYAVCHEGDLYVFFDCMTPSLKFVKRTLEQYPDARHTFFVTHWPVLPCNKTARKWLIFTDDAKAAELRNLLASRNAIVLTGHIHQTTLVQAKFPNGVITQVSVYSLPVTDKTDMEQTVYNGKDFLEQYLKWSEKELAAPILALLEDNYRSFTHYKPDTGVYRMKVEADKVEVEQYSYQGKHLNTIQLLPRPTSRP